MNAGFVFTTLSWLQEYYNYQQNIVSYQYEEWPGEGDPGDFFKEVHDYNLGEGTIFIELYRACRPPPPPIPLPQNQGYLCLFYLRKKIYPLSRVLVIISNYKNTPFPGFLSKSSRHYGQKIYPLSREKWGHACICGPLCVRVGGGGVFHLKKLHWRSLRGVVSVNLILCRTLLFWLHKICLSKRDIFRCLCFYCNKQKCTCFHKLAIGTIYTVTNENKCSRHQLT